MTGVQGLRTISVEGDALHAHIVAALLAQALGPHGCRVEIGDLGEESSGARTAILGPSTLAALAGLGLSGARLQQAGASQRFHWSLPRMAIWIAPFGIARAGVDFHHHLHRINGELAYEAILPFNPARRVAEHAEAQGGTIQSPVPFGYAIGRACLLPTLEDIARRHGVELKRSTEGRADLAIAVKGDGGAEWDDDGIVIPAAGAFPELAPYRCVTAVDRLLSLLPGREHSGPVMAEYNRLSEAEHERIGDFAALLIGDFRRPALARKREVFEACGRIPVEDYEVFPQYYWLSVFLQSGIVPRDYNRLADRVPLAETKAWVADLRRRMDALAAGATR